MARTPAALLPRPVGRHECPHATGVAEARRPARARNLVPLLVALLSLNACGDDPLEPDVAQPADPMVQAFVEEVNTYRGTVGCGPLAWRSDVAAVAQGHSRDMVTRDYFDHYTPEGASPFDRLTAAGIGYSMAAENIAYGYPTAATVLAGWLGSPGHKANLDNCALTEHGVGLDETHWTHLFVTP